ncbi:toll/interleukin-1 receptor domain-containing protein [Oceanidesulfovibrio marinus]|nr:toll/interleukin-1 receptor domain-containing protein [Oceanidesulfovibrio marinus]
MQEHIERFADVLIAYLQRDQKLPSDADFLETAADLILGDLPAEMRDHVTCAPYAYREVIVSVVKNRYYQVGFRRKALAAIGKGASSSCTKSARVFFSYRRAELENLTRHLAHAMRLRPEFSVFFDKNSLSTGSFPPKIETAARSCDVFLLMTCASTFKRTHEPEDWVRKEVIIALESDRLIVPVLVDGAQMPEVASLPLELQSVPMYQAFNFYTSNFETSLLALMAFINKDR